MANVLKMEKQIAVVSGLAEGMSIRGIERMTGVNQNTIMSLNLRVGHGCARVMDSMMRGLDSKTIQMDEIWGFVGKKQRKVTIDDSLEVGDIWTFIAVDADSKIVPCYRIGKRDLPTATAFVSDLASRLNNRIQLSSDALNSYPQAVERAFGCAVDYAQLIKVYATTSDVGPQARYSPGEVIDTEKTVITGFPDEAKISTSYVESQNLTLRMHCRRLTRLTNAFSKRIDSFKAAIGLHFAYYNFVKRHTTLRMTPAMAAGVTSSFWSVADLIEMSKRA
jgi:IS1 family transposase